MVDGVGLAGVDATQALGADAAGQAAGRLRLRSLIGVAGLHLGEATHPFLYWQLGHRHPGGDPHLSPLYPFLDLRPCQFDHRQFGLRRWLQFLPPQVAMDGLSSLMAGGDRLNDERRSGSDVAGSKDPRPCRRQRVGVDGDSLLAGDADPRALRDEGQTSPLPHGEYDVVARHEVLRAGDRHRPPPPCLVGQPLLGAHALYAHHTPITVPHNLHRSNLPVEDDPLLLGAVHLLLVGRRLLAGAAVIDMHL